MIGVVAGVGRIAMTNALRQVEGSLGERLFRELWEVKQ